MNPYGYLRVSGRGQVDGDGPERQKDSILRFCRTHGLGQPEFFFEEGVSGTVEAVDRPEFVRLLESIARMRKVAGEDALACVIVERQDRLARDVIVQELLLLECEKAKIRVFAADQADLANLAEADIDPTRKMLRQIIGVLSEWEKSVLVMKLRAARTRIRKRTGRCEGRILYGATPHERTTRDVMLTLHHAGRSYGDIAKELDRMRYRRRSGKPWTRGSVYQVVKQRGIKPKESPEIPPV